MRHEYVGLLKQRVAYGDYIVVEDIVAPINRDQNDGIAVFHAIGDNIIIILVIVIVEAHFLLLSVFVDIVNVVQRGRGFKFFGDRLGFKGYRCPLVRREKLGECIRIPCGTIFKHVFIFGLVKKVIRQRKFEIRIIHGKYHSFLIVYAVYIGFVQHRERVYFKGIGILNVPLNATHRYNNSVRRAPIRSGLARYDVTVLILGIKAKRHPLIRSDGGVIIGKHPLVIIFGDR